MSRETKYTGNAKRSTSSRSTSGSGSGRTRTSTRSRGRGSSRRKRKTDNTLIYAGLGLIAVLAIVAGVLKFSGKSDTSKTPKDSTEIAAQTEETTTEAYKDMVITENAVIDLSVLGNKSGISDDNMLHVQGMTPAEISEAISKLYDWKLAVVNKKAHVGDTVKTLADVDATTEAATMGDAENPDQGDGEEESSISDITVGEKVEIPDYIAAAIPALIEEIVAADEKAAAAAGKDTKTEETSKEEETTKKSLFGKKETKEETTEAKEEETTSSNEPEVVYTLELAGSDEELEDIVKYAANMWYVEPLGGSIGSYDAANGKFIMENSREGYQIDKDKLLSDIQSAISSKDYTAQIQADGKVLSAEDSANVSGAYTTLATFTTNTTSNAVRNKNVALACQKLNGTIVRPGEEFSFNKTVGQRTKEAGFGEAAAYNNGEVVQEVGGGVCQVSTTLYNAVLKAGLKITARQSHTFKPTYVTPGQDATVSWGGPDFRFANLPNKPEYSYDTSYAIGIRASYSNQVVTVSIYGRPVLKEGYTFSLDSHQTRTMEVVRQLIPAGSDKQPEKGTQGSAWETKLIIKKNGELVSDKVDHTALYSGHIEWYTDETTTAESESESPADGEISDDPQPAGPGGPGAGPGTGPGTATGTSGTTPDGSGPNTNPQTETTAASNSSSAPSSNTDNSSNTPGGSQTVTSPGSSSPDTSASTSSGGNTPDAGPASAGSSSSNSSSSSNAPGSASSSSSSAPGGDISSGPVISNDGPGSLSNSGSAQVSTGGPGM